MSKIEDDKYKEYRLLLDILDEYLNKQFKLEELIATLKSNPVYRGLFKKNYLEQKLSEKKKIDLIIKALEDFKNK